MRRLGQYILMVIILGLAVIRTLGEDMIITNEFASAQKEQLYQRFLKKMQQSMQAFQKQGPSNSDLSLLTNLDTPSMRWVFESAIVDPSFGLEWDEVPPPTLVGSNAMSAVSAFVDTNSWNMQTNDCIFDCIDDSGSDKSKPIRGLPWTAIYDKEFPAVTHNGVLYVFFRGFHHDGRGVAYNPQTNRFAGSIDGFKPIGQHWYVWVYDHEFPSTVPAPQKYEGAK